MKTTASERDYIEALLDGSALLATEPTTAGKILGVSRAQEVLAHADLHNDVPGPPHGDGYWDGGPDPHDDGYIDTHNDSHSDGTR